MTARRVAPWLVGALAVAAMLAYLLRGQAPRVGAVSSSVAASSPVGPAGAAPVQTAALGPAASAPPQPLLCPHQHIDIVRAGGVVRGCVGATRVHQRGSVRSYEVEPELPSDWRLVVEVADTKPVAVRLLQTHRDGRAAAFACDRDACGAVTLGRPDGHGARTLAFEALSLRRAAEVVRVSGSLHVPPDQQLPGLACSTAPVRIVETDGALSEFCAMGGAGFELADDGRPRFQFRNLEGRSVVVALAADGSVERVSLGPWACSGAQCSGLAMQARGDPADPSVQRHFVFSGLTLFDPSSQRPVAALSGELVMAAQ